MKKILSATILLGLLFAMLAFTQVPVIRPFYIYLKEILDIAKTPPTDNYILTYDSSTGLWGPEAITGAGGADISGAPAANDYAKFTDADTIEGRSYLEAVEDLLGSNIHYCDKYADFATALSTIGATESTLVITSQEAVTTDETVPATLQLHFLRGGSLTISNTKTVTINGHVDAGLYQIFEGDGSVAFGLGAVSAVYPEWWGAKGDGTTNDTTAWNSMIAVINTIQSSKVELAPGSTYILGNVSTFDQLDGLVLNFNGATLKMAANTEVGTGKTGYALRFTNCDNITINDPKINGNRGNADYTAGGNGQAHGIFVQYSRNILITNPDIYDCATDGIYIGATTGTTTQRSQRVVAIGGRVYRCRRNNVSIVGALDVEFYLKENTHAGVNVTGSTGIAPKAGIDLEPNASGASNQNENITLAGTKYSDNATCDVAVANEVDGLFIENNEFSTASTASSVNITATSSNCFIEKNYFEGGTFQVVTHASEAHDGLVVRGNNFKNATTYNVSIQGTSIDNLQFSGNTIVANWKAFYLNPIAATIWQSNRVYGNTYVLNDDNNVADTDAMTLRRCVWENDTIIRESGVSNNYRINVSSSTVVMKNIETVNNNIEIYDSSAGSFSNVISCINTIYEWRGSSAPVAGLNQRGNIVWDTTPSAGAALGWICVSSGTPGIWETMAILDLQGSAIWDPGSIANGAEEMKEVTVTGAALGDFAIASFSLDVTDLVLNAQVTAANTATVILANNTGGAIDLAEGTVYVKVIKR